MILVTADAVDEDALMVAAIEAGAEDVAGRRRLQVLDTSRPTSRRCATALEAAGIEIESAELTMLPKTTVELDETTRAR